jgi:hypothetical protein
MLTDGHLSSNTFYANYRFEITYPVPQSLQNIFWENFSDFMLQKLLATIWSKPTSVKLANRNQSSGFSQQAHIIRAIQNL